MSANSAQTGGKMASNSVLKCISMFTPLGCDIRRTVAFIFIAALLTQVAGCYTYRLSAPEPIPEVGQKSGFNALRLALPDVELTVEAIRPGGLADGVPAPLIGRWPVDKGGAVLILMVIDPMRDGVWFDPSDVRYKFNHDAKAGVAGTAAWVMAKPAVRPAVVQTPSTPASGQGRHSICFAERGSRPPYQRIVEMTFVRTRTCFRLFFEDIIIGPHTVFTLTVDGVSTTGKLVAVPPIQFGPRTYDTISLPAIIFLLHDPAIIFYGLAN